MEFLLLTLIGSCLLGRDVCGNMLCFAPATSRLQFQSAKDFWHAVPDLPLAA